ncbi:small RNA 2'-O-methyltransferase [Phoenix dactylifera]|uniref:Small RNA 2'-O-methyltransferase n=1 Tax=Phoenix dactylifera TaxID=42345 RepID=A0A8B7D362_PHODC|nr:small RNA 2'-O-methyltransferase [Phoenix dactylifera]XP_008812124.2 small RNA 2'-O-methyltransferase [Phoenix dactylifera]
MGTQESPAVAVNRPTLTPKALIYQKYGNKACYRIEEELQSADCPGLVIPQQTKILYRCYLDLPELSVTSDTFPRKKEAEQSAAKIAIEKLGIQFTTNNPTPQEAWNELVARVSVLFTDEFLSSSHPLIGHFRVAFGRVGHCYGMLPISAIAACDVKANNLCKTINPKTESDPLSVISLILKAAKMSGSIFLTDGKLLIKKQGLYSPEALQSFLNRYSVSMGCIQIEAIYIPCSIEEHVETLTLDVSDNQYYLDEIAKKLNVADSSQIVVSRTVGKASSEMKLYFPIPEAPLMASISSDLHATVEGNIKTETILNKRASYFSGQKIYGDAVLANIGYTWKSSDLFYEDISLCSYYRMLLNKVPDGHYKLSREAILAAVLPAAFTTRSNWKGPTPRDLLSVFCHQHRLSEPIFSVRSLSSPETSSELSEMCKISNSSKLNEEIEMADGGAADVIDKDMGKSGTFRCEVKILSRRREPIVDCFLADTYTKENDAIQNSALKVLTFFNKLFKQLDMPVEKLFSFGCSHGVNVNLLNFSREFATWLSTYHVKQNYSLERFSSLGSVCMNQPHIKQENGMILLNIEGPDSGVFPSPGCLTCISYVVALVGKDGSFKDPLESNDEFEFEIGTGAVINQLEACVTQLSVKQAAQFIIELPSKDLILAAAGESANHLSQSNLCNCYLEYTVKVLQVTEPLEDRMEQALFSPPLSKQRVEFALGHINESRATTLVDFGCGSGSLLELLVERTTTLEKIVGVDLSRKSLIRAAKILHQKLSSNSLMQTNIRSVVLYDGSITDFDARLYGFDIGTCLEVIEHMEEDQACLFGDVVLSFFCPSVLIVSTPNYEYNPILQRSTIPNKEDDSEEKSAPCKFRNHDHKFEWTREQFNHWATDLAARHNYIVEFSGVGGSGDVEPGFASQISVFRRNSSREAGNCWKMEESSQAYQLIWEWTNSSRSVL